MTMKHGKRPIMMRTALLSMLLVSLLVSAAVFFGANAAENVSPTDVSRSDVSPSDATRSDVSMSDANALRRAAAPKVNQVDPDSLGEPKITMVTEMDVSATMELRIEGTDIHVDWGDGNAVACASGIVNSELLLRQLNVDNSYFGISGI